MIIEATGIIQHSPGYWDADQAEWRQGDPYERHPAWRDAAAIEAEVGLEWDDPTTPLDFFVDDPNDSEYFADEVDELAVRYYVRSLTVDDLQRRAA